MAKEIELKYRVQGCLRNMQIFGHPAIAKRRKKLHIHYYESVYLDTPDGDVEKSGLSIRGRSEDDVLYIYAKKWDSGEGALSTRDEWRAKSNDLPNAARILARRGAPTKHLIDKRLIVTGHVTFKRIECLVMPKPGFSYMFSYDVGFFAKKFKFDEIELELVEGTKEDLIAAGEELAKDLWLTPETKSKHERAIFYNKIRPFGLKEEKV